MRIKFQTHKNRNDGRLAVRRAGAGRLGQLDAALDFRLQQEEEVQGLARRRFGHDDLHQPCGQAICRANDLLAGGNMRVVREHVGALLERLEEGEVHELARSQRVDVGVGDAHQRLPRHIRPRRDPDGEQERLHHEVYVPGPEVRGVDRPAAHSGVDLDELRPDGGVLALHVEDTVGEAQRLDRADGQLLQGYLLLAPEQRWRHSPRLVEVGLQRGAVVRHRGVLPLTLGHHDVDVDLCAVQVALEHERRADAVLGLLSLTVVLDQGAARDHERSELRVHLLEGLQKLLAVLDLLHAQRRRSGDGLEHRGEADLPRSRRQVGLALDAVVGRRREARIRQASACAVLVTGLVHRLGQRAWQTQGLRHPRGRGNGKLDDCRDAVRLSEVGVA
mmetsp:Transcript_67408/g.197949  ORF Transcript_67408/g.197949 Transcript_67408/m.197949 type:complete len:390 (-) Transcript_67408:1010-2179(-)